MRSPKRVRDAVLELAREQDPDVKVSTSFPIGTGTFFTLRPSDECHTEKIKLEVRRRWMFCDVSSRPSDLDGVTDVGILVPSESTVWSLSKEAGKRWWVSILIRVCTRSTLVAAFVVFVVAFFDRLKNGQTH